MGLSAFLDQDGRLGLFFKSNPWDLDVFDQILLLASLKLT